MDLDERPAEIADELYALDPADFTAGRDRHVKAARAAGDRDLAKAVAALRRPTRSAWAVNQLARTHARDLAELLDVGARMREAQRNLRRDDLRELTAERRDVIGTLQAAARDAATESGHELSEAAEREVTSTLEAALADEAAGEQVRTGRLTQPLAYAGFGVDAGTSTAGPSRRASSAKPRTASQTTKPAKKVAADELADRRAAKAAAKVAADADAAEKEAAVDAAAVDKMAARHRQLADRVSALEADVEAARAEYRSVGSELRAARKTAAASERRARAARRRLDEGR